VHESTPTGSADLAPPGATPTLDSHPRRIADFETLGQALDYAALGKRGLNFHDARGTLVRSYPYSSLAEDSLANARRFLGLGIRPGDRIALIAETGPEFAAAFFGSIYAGAWPVPLASCQPALAAARAMSNSSRCSSRAATRRCSWCRATLPRWPPRLRRRAGHGSRLGQPAETSIRATCRFPRPIPMRIAYLQYSSGSTRFPHGVAITHRGLLDNLRAHGVGLHIKDSDRCISWLPWYHDMGLVGCLLSPVALQVSCDYQKTEDFARRPLAWLDMISRNPGTSVSYSPTFGYDICARRMSSQTRAEDRFDLTRWRIAGNGADMIRPDVMQAFVDAFAGAGFDAAAFCPSYGLAEATLAVSLDAAGRGNPHRAGRGGRIVRLRR
jgi:fatty-acyl-CoA synthase